ncbi:hypothetical protein Aduo_004362 [Ancylostoma duodenale]
MGKIKVNKDLSGQDARRSHQWVMCIRIPRGFPSPEKLYSVVVYTDDCRKVGQFADPWILDILRIILYQYPLLAPRAKLGSVCRCPVVCLPLSGTLLSSLPCFGVVKPLASMASSVDVAVPPT